MPLPRWLARLNRRFVNPGMVAAGSYPVLVHVGRSSGRVHRTPLDAHPVAGGYLFTCSYGSGSDWVRNVLAAGEATVDVDGDVVALRDPRMISQDQAWQMLPEDTYRLPGFLGITDYLFMRVAPDGGAVGDGGAGHGSGDRAAGDD